MKTKLILAFILTLICGTVLQAKEETLNFKLQVNQQRFITKDKLKMRFISILEDSRCPEGTRCVWAGNAKVQLKIKKKNGVWEIFELNTNLEKREIKVDGYAIKILDLTPTPKANVKINRNGYVATFSITKI